MADDEKKGLSIDLGGAMSLFGFGKKDESESIPTPEIKWQVPSPPHVEGTSLDQYQRDTYGPNLPKPDLPEGPRVYTPEELARLRSYAAQREYERHERLKREKEEGGFLYGAGQYLGTIGDFYDQSIKTPIQTHVTTPMRSKAAEVEQGADPFMGGTAISLARTAYNLAPETVGGFIPEEARDYIPTALAALEGQNVLGGGFANKTMAGRYDLAMSLGQEFGFGDDIAAMQQNLPMNEFRTLLGPGHSTTDADAIQRIMNQSGLDIGALKDQFLNLPGAESMAGLLAPNTMGLVNKLEELQNADSEVDRAAALEELKQMIASLGENGEALRAELQSFKDHSVFGPMIEKGMEDTGIKFDTILEAIKPVVNITEGMLNDEEDKLKKGIQQLGEIAPKAYRAYQERNMDLMMMEGDSAVEARAKNKLIENILEQTLVLAGGDAADIKKIVEGQDWEQILKETPELGSFGERISEHADVVGRAAGELAAEGKMAPDTLHSVNRVVGDEITDSLVQNPLLMAGLFGGGAFALGGIGSMIGGEDSMLQGALPMLAPILMRAGLGSDEYEQGISGIESAIGKFTDPIFQPIFDKLPKELYDVPILGGILQGYRDSPLQLATTLTGALTGNKALKQASVGLGLSNFIFGASDQAVLNTARNNAITTPSNPAASPPIEPIATAQSSVGDSKQNADMNMVLGEQIHALDVFSPVGQRTIQ